MHLEVLGPFRLSGATGPLPKKVQGLLAYLAVHAGRPVAREQLCALLWSDHGAEQARHSLRQSLVPLRASLAAHGSDVIRADAGTVALNLSNGFDVDVREFEELARAATPEKLSSAAKLYRGEFLAGLRLDSEPFSEWVALERRRFAAAMSDVLYRLASALNDDTEAAIAAAQQLAAFDPLREDGQRLLMRLLATAGRRDAALKQHAICVAILKRELGVAPEPETAALAEAIQRGKLSGDTAPVRVGKPVRSHTRKAARPVRHRDREHAASSLASADRPSIAVLPFANLSGDPDQDYFAAGVVDDIANELGREKWLLVISSNSAFVYKAPSTDVAPAGSEPRVRYVLNGSVRRSNDRLRINTRLIDKSNDTYIWANRFDGGNGDVLEIQDRVARQLAGMIAPRLRAAEIERAKRKSPASLTAYDMFLRAAAIHRISLAKNQEALRLLYKAIEINASYGAAYGLAAWCCQLQKVLGWVRPDAPVVNEGIRLAYLAAETGKDDPEALWMAGQGIALLAGEMEHGLALIDKSIYLNPNSASAWMSAGTVRTYRGDTERALECLDEARRLNPVDPLAQYHWIGVARALFFAGRYDEALAATEKALHEQAGYAPALRMRAATCGLLGRAAEGNEIVRRLLAVNPDASVSRLRDYHRVSMCRIPAALEAYLEGLRRSGLPLE
jgi:TolB-like protein